MRHVAWIVLPALLIGLGIGLALAWVVFPLGAVNSSPGALRADFKDQYRSAIAAAFASNGNLERARARLELLGDTDAIVALNAQAQRMLADNKTEQASDAAALASALAQGNAYVAPVLTTSTPYSYPTTQPTAAEDDALSAPTVFDDFASLTSETSLTQIVVEATARPTQTRMPTQSAPFALIGQESLCDANLPDGLLQILVLNANRKQLPGAEVHIAWAGGKESFFTGLKPELGNGYADFIMTPDVSYTVQLALGSDVAAALLAPSCKASNGALFTGGFKLTFQQP
ncbi:MAG: hypothetical protein HS124_06455 [Anaerolineales bacterium]|nr:hypothetical protein [Anaerolineales bacterium]MCL4260078.1 hypothetical protein [Anaerolineales bacterium]